MCFVDVLFVFLCQLFHVKKIKINLQLYYELILNVYEEYKAFCAKYKKKPNIDFNLQIKKEETVSRPKPIPESPPNIFGQHENNANE